MDAASLYNTLMGSIHIILAVVLVFAIGAAAFAVNCALHCINCRKMARKATHGLSVPIEDV